MALKILKKAEKLPEGGDRFLWNELPIMRDEAPKKGAYSTILKFSTKGQEKPDLTKK